MPRIKGATGTSGADGGAAGGAAGALGSGGSGGGPAGGGASDGGSESPSTTCDAASPPGPPKVLRPTRGAYTGSLHAPTAIATLRPTFSWAAVAPTCGAVTYELQADDSCSPGALDACAFPSPELDATGVSALTYAPAANLKVSTTAPVGAFYAWRVRACDASSRCGPWSEVRYLHVGRVREDINGDGYGDLLAVSNRGIEVYLGSSQFDVSGPSLTIPYGSYGDVPTFSGDVNGDGYGDFFGATIYLPSSGQAPTIYFGGSTIATPQTLVLTKSAGGPSTMMQTTSAGDLNGDGFADLIVQWAYGITTPTTELRVFFGGIAVANTPDLSIPGPYVNDYTLQHSGRVGDLNGDGFEDIALTAFSDERANGGMVQLFVGGRHPTSTAVSLATMAAEYRVEPIGDVNQDGFDDALIVYPGASYALYRGAATLATTVAMTWNDATASSATGGFDLDRDGFSDFVVGTTAFMSILYRGGATNPARVASGISRLTSSTIVAFSDHDGDGRPDLVGLDSSNGPASIQWAGSDGTTDPRSFIVRLPDDVMFHGELVR
jgi:hypothetical protein